MTHSQIGHVWTAGRITIIIIAAVILVKVLHSLVGKFTERAARGPRKQKTQKQQEIARRRDQRARAIGSVLHSATTVFFAGMATLLVLGELGVNLGPVLASAGVIGVALGFGAQELVRDFMSGIAMIVEDQYGVGDQVEFSTADDDGIPVVGTVELVALRITKIRDESNVVWYVRNGEVQKVGNRSQGAALKPGDDVDAGQLEK